MREATMREVEAHRAFSHPNLMPLIDWGALTSGGIEVMLLLFPLCEGGSVRDAIDRRPLAGRPWPERELLALFRGVCAGARCLLLFALRRAGLALKLQNVLCNASVFRAALR